MVIYTPKGIVNTPYNDKAQPDFRVRYLEGIR